MKSAAVVLAGAVLALLAWWVWADTGTVPRVSEIQEDEMTFDEIVERVRRAPGIEKPEAYAATLYRRAYGRNP